MNIHLIAGHNGAGKTTFATTFLPESSKARRRKMIRNQDFMTVEDKVAAAAKTARQTVIDTARRTGTKIIVMRDGQIEHLTPDQMRDLNTESRKTLDSM